MDSKKLLGLKIKYFRKSRKLTQEKLSELINVDSGYVCKMELGQHTPSLTVLEKLAEVLNVEIKDFFDFKDLQECDYQTKLHRLIDTLPKEKQRQLLQIANIVL